MKISNIAFGKGFVKIPSMNKAFNPDNVLTITENADKKSSILFNDCIYIEDVNAPVDEVIKCCTLAQKTGGVVNLTENNYQISYKA